MGTPLSAGPVVAGIDTEDSEPAVARRLPVSPPPPINKAHAGDPGRGT